MKEMLVETEGKMKFLQAPWIRRDEERITGQHKRTTTCANS